MKLKVVACGVFEPELLALANRTPNEVHLHFLDAGLHNSPDLLREMAQGEIDRAVGAGYDAILLFYGLCGRGTSGLLARDAPVVLPRVHDCMTLFLGSREEYRRQFKRHPGTFYITPGWYEKRTQPGDLEQVRGGRGEVTEDPRFPPLAAKYGPLNAADIIRFQDSWKRNYTRAAFIDTGFGDSERYAGYARTMAEAFGWVYERLVGNADLVARLLAGDWDESHAFVLRPGQRSALTGDERIFTAIERAGAAEPASDATASDVTVLPPCETMAQEAPPRPAARLDRPQAPAPGRASGVAEGPELVGLGIDAGGTYTDCVLYDLHSNTLLAKAKAPTTHHDLLQGIEHSLDSLERGDPGRIRLVALSTTLATNSIVEGKGGRPGAIIMSSLPTATAGIAWEPLKQVAGEMGIDGYEIVPPDPVEVLRAVDELLAAGVDAFAVSGYAGVKNPSHELQVKALIRRRCDLPVICGHELSTRLNYVNRANTAILNARLLPLVRELLDAVQAALHQRGIRAPLMVVKGDGSLVNRETALERPVEAVLSGPAASVSGARHLTGLEEAIVLDMGGTTTDTAILEHGLVRISPEGARVGGWRTSVEAADIATVGLGGDSYLSFTADRRLLIGPRRVVPLAYLCACHPQAKAGLEAIDPAALTDRSTPDVLDFFFLAREDGRASLNRWERSVVAALQDGPLSRQALAVRTEAQSGLLVRPRRLEELRIVQRAALTPTDLLHVTGEFTAWDAEAARHGLQVFAELYGLSPEEMIRRVFWSLVERLAGQVIGKEVPGVYDHDPDQWPLLLRTVFRPHEGGKLRASLTYGRPIVAIGAPVAPFFPAVGQCLNAQVVIPPHAEVANAIGAVASEVVVREQAVVRPGEVANYVVYARSGRTEYEELNKAVAAARAETAMLARERARRAGTSSHRVKHRVQERRAFSTEGDQVLIEVLVEATVSGRPVLAGAVA